MKAGLTSLALVVVCGYVLLPDARAQGTQLNPRCTVEVAGRNGKNMEAEQVASALLTQGCTAGTVVRMSDIQPGHDASNGGLVGGGDYYRRLLCQEQPFTTDGPPNGTQAVTCTYNGSKAGPAR